MADKEALLHFVTSVDWKKHIDDPEISSHVKAIRDRIENSSKSGKDSSQGGARPSDDVDLTNATRIKLVVVGDGAVGKTSLLISYATGKFPTEYVPTVFENYTAQIDHNEQTILLHLWDTAGQEDYDRLRPLSYPGADVVLLCFSTINRASYVSVKEKWYPEVNHYVPNIPHILVGTKIDCREEKVPDPNLGKFDPITTEMGKEMQQQISAAKYLEVSSRTREGLDNVFHEAVGLALKERQADAAKDANMGGKVKKERKKDKGCLLL